MLIMVKTFYELTEKQQEIAMINFSYIMAEKITEILLKRQKERKEVENNK